MTSQPQQVNATVIDFVVKGQLVVKGDKELGKAQLEMEKLYEELITASTKVCDIESHISSRTQKTKDVSSIVLPDTSLIT